RQRIVTRDRTLGASIARQLPRAPRAAGSVFPDDWRRRTVGSLGFGAAMTRVLATAQDVPPSNEASELGAVLFMGTSAFDHVCDRSTSRRRELLALVNGDTLGALARGTGGDLEARDPDVRYVLGYVHAFFARFSRWVPEGPARARALALLHDAYAAERRTFEPDEAVSAAVSVRTLTFATTSAIICAVGRHECGDAHRCEEQARRLGRAAAILDDLADLASDARTDARRRALGRDVHGGCAVGHGRARRFRPPSARRPARARGESSAARAHVRVGVAQRMSDRLALDVHVPALEGILREVYDTGRFTRRERAYVKRGGEAAGVRTSNWALDLRVPLARSELLQPIAAEMAATLQRAGISQIAGRGFGSYQLVGGIVAVGSNLSGGLVRDARKPYAFTELDAANALRKEGYDVIAVYTVFRFAWRRGRSALWAANLGHRCLASLRRVKAAEPLGGEVV